MVGDAHPTKLDMRIMVSFVARMQWRSAEIPYVFEINPYIPEAL